jgi:hypothetical protein
LIDGLDLLIEVLSRRKQFVVERTEKAPADSGQPGA